jgi:hypothetical protein
MSIIETPASTTLNATLVTAERVAKTIAGIAQIGVAQRRLEAEGFQAQICANKIEVEGIEAQLLGSNGSTWWQVHAIDGTKPVWSVGTTPGDTSVSSWAGAL